jgi:hypothetical protein
LAIAIFHFPREERKEANKLTKGQKERKHTQNMDRGMWSFIYLFIYLFFFWERERGHGWRGEITFDNIMIYDYPHRLVVMLGLVLVPCVYYYLIWYHLIWYLPPPPPFLSCRWEQIFFLEVKVFKRPCVACMVIDINMHGEHGTWSYN